MPIVEYATQEGTQRYRKRFEAASVAGLSIADGHFRQTFGGLHLTSLGMGTYLGNTDPDTSREMAEAAVRSVSSGAINVLDTAINYRYQLSERALGEALRQLRAEYGIQRDELFICSKNGFLSPDAERQPRNEDFRNWFRTRYLDSGWIEADDVVGGMHCMAPAYLRDQLQISLENLGLETLDLLYLHNASESQLPLVGPDVFFSRLAKAFETLESARADGKIRYYGLATWNAFRVESSNLREYVNLEAVTRLAETIGGPNHGFCFVQLPLNLAFPEALTVDGQTVNGESMSLLEAAAALEIGVFTSVPLLQGQLLESRLPSLPGMQTPAQICLQFARSHPGVLAPLVGHKRPEHVAENLLVAGMPPLPLSQFEDMLATSRR